MMEDPWGSPWTTVDPSDSKSSKRTDLEPPPRAFLSATTSSSSIPAFSYHSPWAAGDDGFGDWSSAADPLPGTGGTPGSLSVWGGWTTPGTDAPPAAALPTLSTTARSRENSVPSPRSRSRSRDGSIGGVPSPIAWPTSVATSPGFRTVSRSNSSSVLRLPSLDPWASELSNLEASLSSPPKISSPRRASTLDAARSQTKSPASDAADDTGHIPPHTTELGTELQGLRFALGDVHQLNSPGWAEDEEELSGSSRHTPVATSRSADTTVRQDKSEEAREPQERQPRLSLSSSEDSGQAEGCQDSPITSIDEDCRPQVLDLTRPKLSNKVLDLVEMYDGIAKSAIADPPPALTPERRMRSTSRTPADGGRSARRKSLPRELADNAGRKQPGGDPKTGGREGNEEAQSEDFTPERTPTPETRPRGHPTATNNAGDEPRRRPESKPRHKASLDRVSFTADLGALDVLFDPAILARIPPLDGDVDVTVPDGLLLDTFAAVSERRAWYLVSRQGTARMHNAGGEEYYRRTTWHSSQVRAETVKIVRRWMEEDSIAGGRPTLGGGAGKGKGNIFGWGDTTAAEPVRVDELFAKRRKQRQWDQQQEPPSEAKRPASLALAHGGTEWTLDSRIARTSAAEAVATRPHSAAEAPGADFAWSSSRAVGQTKTGLSNGADIAPQPSPTSAAWPGPLKPPGPPGTRTTEVATATQADDDDDDWGEMISSPTPQNGSELQGSLTVQVLPGTRPGTKSESQGPKAASSETVKTPPASSHRRDPDVTLGAAKASQQVPVPVPPQIPSSKAAPPPPKGAAGPAASPDESAVSCLSREQEALILAVVGSLPDLSYMLR